MQYQAKQTNRTYNEADKLSKVIKEQLKDPIVIAIDQILFNLLRKPGQVPLKIRLLKLNLLQTPEQTEASQSQPPQRGKRNQLESVHSD
jgi:hypothetical protein